MAAAPPAAQPAAPPDAPAAPPAPDDVTAPSAGTAAPSDASNDAAPAADDQAADAGGATPTAAGHRPHHGPVWPLALAALGIVFGDIGTSPLYALRECFNPAHGVAATAANVLGVLSLIVWSLVIVISIKYVGFILRADNQGEGGILALIALISPRHDKAHRWRGRLILLGLFGAALLYGDGVITPAISVLSAVEGLAVLAPSVDHNLLLALTVGILIGLFAFQHRGTASVGAVFGPIMLLWFAVLALLGVAAIADAPAVLAAVNPLHGARFFAANGFHGFVILGSVFLVVTGGEALYADMGHFGARPIRLAWFALVLPCLLLNYFGQGALLLVDPAAAAAHPFYQLAPGWALAPLVMLATCATVIASQALISGAYSLTMQAIQLGYSPRLDIRHTSAEARGQIYIGAINWALLAMCIAVVLGFRTSSNLAAAYGIAVTSTMAITTALFYAVLRERWGWSQGRALALCAVFLVIDLAFFGANLLKLFHGGWFPLVVAGGVFAILTTWHTGRKLLAIRLAASTQPLRTFLAEADAKAVARVPGTAVFLYSNARGTPPALIQNLRHNQVLHRQIVVVHVDTADVPYLPVGARTAVERLRDDVWRVTIRSGFMEQPDVPRGLAAVEAPGWSLDPRSVTYFLSRERIIATRRPGMAVWREHLFAWLSRNAQSATYYYGLPPAQVVELGTQLPI